MATIIDVRASPHSRRREFAFKHLARELPGAGIGYESWPVLGAPQVARDAAKAGDAQRFYQLYASHLEEPKTQDALHSLAERAVTEAVALLCYERDPAECHRLLIAERLERSHKLASHHLAG
ncbi:DUF488 family protein [Halorhodospira halochloris]|uniref:DUF488 family protein, N3 subclade n=1 Tax=Halorhodospira halochloris TaxID=1052 RepID=UPI003B75BDA3